MATITPPLRPVAEPPTPRHGPKHDLHEPYLRRRSSRLKSTRTPSPGEPVQNNKHTARRPRNYQAQHHPSPPSSPLSLDTTSPKRRTARAAQTTQMEFDEHQLLPKHQERMLPTPKKTPSKPQTKHTTTTSSRILFPHGLHTSAEEITPRRVRNSLYSPGPTTEVEIYTDMDARVPELDKSEENVFYDTPHRRSVRARVRVQELERTDMKRKALELDKDRDNGMWFTFRGKKVWREFEADDQSEFPPNTDMTGLPQIRKITPEPRFLKTAHKPRRLFPEAYKKGDTTDEEAVTDIEHPEKHELSSTKADVVKPANTPAKQRFYATPPTTARTTRSTAKRDIDELTSDADELSTSLFAVKRGKKTSPFNEWSRTKSDSGSGSQDKKRRAGSPSSPQHKKRVRSDVSD